MRANISRQTATANKVLRPVGHMVLGATLLIVLGFTVWITVNSDVMWKAIRYPEAVRQMEVEVQIKK